MSKLGQFRPPKADQEPTRQHPPEADELPDGSAERSLMSSLQDQVGNRAAQRLLASPGSPLEPTLRQDADISLSPYSTNNRQRMTREPVPSQVLRRDATSKVQRKPTGFDTNNAVHDAGAEAPFDIDPVNIAMTAEAAAAVKVHAHASHEGEILVKTQIHKGPDLELVLKQPSEVSGRDAATVSLAPTGKVGETLIVFLCYWRPPGSEHLHSAFTKAVPVTVRSSRTQELESLEARLESLEQRRLSGKYVSKEEQDSAEYKSGIAAHKLLREVGGADVAGQIPLLLGRITGEIGQFENARARGYLQAITELNAKALDKTADYKAFGISLAGNLLWAIAGLVPELGLVLGISKLDAFFKAAAKTYRASMANVAVSTVGAMMVQFSSGLPVGSSTSDAKSKLIETMTNANKAVCDALRRDAYRLLAQAMATRPPYSDDDFGKYLADLEMGLEGILLGPYSEAAVKEGGSYQQQARSDLLRAYLVSSSAIDDGDLIPTQAVADKNFVPDALSLLGGLKKLGLGKYELVANQMRTAAALLGYQLEASDEQVAELGGVGGLKVKPVVNDPKQRKQMWAALIDNYVISMSHDELSSISDEKGPEVAVLILKGGGTSWGEKYSEVYSLNKLWVRLAKGSPLQEDIEFNVRRTTYEDRKKMKQAMKPGLLDRVSD